MFYTVQTILVLLIVCICYVVGQGEEKDRGKWHQKYDHQFPYEVGGKSFFYAQSREKDGNNWFIQELKSGGKMGEETDHGFWSKQYQSIFSFSIEKPYFFGQNSDSKNWFIQELRPDGKMGKETDHGFFDRFYNVMFAFQVGRRQYFYGQSAGANNYFIQELLPNGKIGKETANGFWSKFYDIQFPFSINGKQYFYGKSQSDNYYFIQELKSNGLLGDETDNGHSSGSVQIPFKYSDQQFIYIEDGGSWYISEITADGKMQDRIRNGDVIDPHNFAYHLDGGTLFFYGQNSNNDWYIDQIVLCEKPKQLDRRNIHEFTLATWNMQGANNDGENKWTTLIQRRMAEFDIVALQESGGYPPGSSEAVRNRAPVHSVGTERAIMMEVNQRTWRIDRTNTVYIYHVRNGNRQDRTSMAIVSWTPADQVYVLGPFGRNNRPIIGIRHGSDFFFNIHAGPYEDNEVPEAVEAIEQRMSIELMSNPEVTWIILGDFNRNANGADIASQLRAPPGNVHRDVIIPDADTHHSPNGRGSLLDYAITGSGVNFIRRLIFQAQTGFRTLSDHNWVSFTVRAVETTLLAGTVLAATQCG